MKICGTYRVIERDGTEKVWADFAARHPTLADDDSQGDDGGYAEEFRDEYIRLPYDDVPLPQECRW